MKSTLFAALLALALAVPCGAQTLTANSASGDLLDGEPNVIITLSGDVPPALETQALDPANYSVTASAPIRTGDVVPGLEGTKIEVSRVTFSGTRRKFLVLFLSGLTYGKGTVEVAEMSADGATIQATEEPLEWEISQGYDTRPTLAHDLSLRVQGTTSVADFSFTYSGFEWKTAGKHRRFSATLEGSAPLGTPEDVEEEEAAETDASEEVADFYKLSLLSSSYTRNGLLSSFGVVARSTSQFEGLEAVGTYQLAWLFGKNRLFTGGNIEAGYRRGDAEWMSLTQPAPDRGDVVARVGAVLEYGPQIGPINRDLGAGLRFFIRGRGWADWAKDETAEEDVRFRGFLDSELFYNISDEFRVFLRYENGYLPPDLSQRRSETFVGVGTAF